MKRIAIFILIAVVLSCLCGCGQKKPFEYSGDNADLYTEAIHSILGGRGRTIGNFRSEDPVLELVEQDLYGRKLFLYYEGYIMGKQLYFLFVSQQTESGFVFYYPDYNFIIGEFQNHDETALEVYTDNKQPWWENIFSESQVDELKSINDWDQEIKLEKCIRQMVVQKKEDFLSTKKKIALYEGVFEESRSDGDFYVDYSTKDDDGKLLYLVTYWDTNRNDYRMVIIDGDSHYNQKITDVMAYQDELAAFKREHNWKKS